MHKRILYGSLMIVLLAGLLALDGWIEHEVRARQAQLDAPDGVPLLAAPLALVLVVLAVPAFLEVVRLAAMANVLVLRVSGLFGVIMLGTLPFWWQFTGTALGGAAALGILAAALIVIFAEQMIAFSREDALRRAGATTLTVVYLGAGFALMLGIRFSFGVPALALFLLAVKFTDIGAYFMGKAFGRHKLVPSISPGKSWEGLAGGVVIGVGVSMLGARLLSRLPGTALGRVSLAEAAVFGLFVAMAGQFADLCESLLKRSAKAKDSGRVVPEFGGVLDILDSPLLAAPVAYGLLAAFTA
jgi:phosphatidate cytidylyltransferase